MALADDLEALIERGVFRRGEKLPSIRRLHLERGLSIGTVGHALAELERRGLIEAKPRSGYFVTQSPRSLSAPNLHRHRLRPRRVPTPHLADDFVTASADPGLVPLGGAVLGHELLPLKALARATRDVSVRRIRSFAMYGPPAGAPELRRQIAQRMVMLGLPCDAEEIVISSGCMDAIRLALLAVAKPGDIVAVESPTFFGFLQLLRDIGLYALEVPTDPRHGIDLQSVARAVSKHDVRALIVTPNFQNPTGAVISDDGKRELARLARKHRFTIIEDDIYGDLHFGKVRPRPLASLADGADVIYCSSFSKNLAPGLRVGWTIPGRHLDRIRRLKLSGTITSPALNQLIIANVLETGSFDRHLRRLRASLKGQVAAMSNRLSRELPQSVRATAPQGGFLLWLEFEPGTDAQRLYEQAHRRGVSILPGSLCSVDGRYKHHVRLCCGHPWSPQLDKGVKVFANLLKRGNR